MANSKYQLSTKKLHCSANILDSLNRPVLKVQSRQSEHLWWSYPPSIFIQGLDMEKSCVYEGWSVILASHSDRLTVSNAAKIKNVSQMLKKCSLNVMR